MIQPEALAERQVRELGRGDSVTVITGEPFLEVASKFSSALKDLEERTIEDTLLCVARGVSYRYVALKGSKAERSLVDMQKWIDKLCNDSEALGRLGADSDKLRSLLCLKVAAENAAEICLPWQRIVLLEWARSKRRASVRQMFVFADGADVDGQRVTFYYVPSEEHRKMIDERLPDAVPFVADAT